MSNSNGIISGPVSVSDVSTVLGVSSGDVGTLCSSSAINKWAKYKPIRSSKEGPVNSDDIANAMGGFDIAQFDSAADLDGETAIWVYLRPRGLNGGGAGLHEWFRLLDFNGYNHNSVIPFSLRLPDSALISSATMVQLLITQNLPTGNLALTDIGDFGDCYFGVAMFKDNNTPYFKTASKKLSVGDVDATKINIENIPFFTTAGTVRLYAFLGKTQASNDNTRQYDHDLWFLNAEDGMAYREVLVHAQAQNVYIHAIGGLTATDKKVLGSASISITGGVFYATRSKVGTRDFSKIYTLGSVVATAKLHSTGAVVATQNLNVNSSGPSTLEPGDPPGAPYTFYCPMPSWSLPAVSDPDDYYDITMTFNYS